MPIVPDHAQARRCRIGIDLLPKLLGAADPWSDKESQSDYWLGSARSTPDELTRGKQQKIRLLFGHEYRYSWTSIITSESCPFLHCLAAQWFNIQLNNTATTAHPQQWHDSESPCNSCKRQIHDSRQEQQAVVRVSFQEVGILSRNQGSIGTKPDHLVAKAVVCVNFPEVSSLDIPFSWQSFVPPPSFGCLPPGISLSLDILSRDASTFSWSGLPLTSLALGGLTHFFLLTTFFWFHRRLLTFLSFGTVLLTLLALHIPFQLTSVSPDIFVPCSLEILLSWKKQVLFGASFLDPHFPGPPSLDIPFLLSRCFLRGSFYTQMLLRSFTLKNLDSQKGFTQRSLYAQELLRTDVFAQRNFYTRELVHAKDLRTRKAFTRRSFYAQATFTHRKLLHVESFRTQKLVHKVALAHSKLLLVHAEVFPRWKLLRKRFYRGFYAQRALTHRCFYAQTHTQTHAKLLHTEALTQGKITHRSLHTHGKLLHTEAFMHTKVLHPDVFAHRQRLRREGFYTTKAFAHRSFDTQTLFHTQSFHPQKLLHR